MNDHDGVDVEPPSHACEGVGCAAMVDVDNWHVVDTRPALQAWHFWQAGDVDDAGDVLGRHDMALSVYRFQETQRVAEQQLDGGVCHVVGWNDGRKRGVPAPVVRPRDADESDVGERPELRLYDLRCRAA